MKDRRRNSKKLMSRLQPPSASLFSQLVDLYFARELICAVRLGSAFGKHRKKNDCLEINKHRFASVDAPVLIFQLMCFDDIFFRRKAGFISITIYNKIKTPS